jgi:succinate dehydrogenase hydrophobic anchor subunit
MNGTPATARRFPGRPDDVPPGFVPGDDGTVPAGAAGSTHAGTLWIVKAVSGVLLIGFLGLHLVAQHLLVDGGLRDFQAVVAYLRHPLGLAAEIGLLASVIVHAALGVRAVLVDVLPSERAVRRGTWIVAAGAVAAFSYGIALTVILLRS